jgi:glutamate N-acetyltransferase / amino-acid N-acetyltransferase
MGSTGTLSDPRCVTSPRGFKACGIRCGLKKRGKDLALLVSDRPAATAALFTTNRLPAAPIQLSRQRAQAGVVRAVLINSGNANACTGERGLADAVEMTGLVAKDLDLDPRQVLVASTGIIGVPLRMAAVRAGVKKACRSLSTDGGEDAAHAIMTTDTRPKHFVVRFAIDGKPCRIGAMAKGSGMINPRVATMICVMSTDAAIQPALLRGALTSSVGQSLNALTIDGEMSTNDAVFLLANGAAGNTLISRRDKNYRIFSSALQAILTSVAEALAADGEGATRLVKVTVDRAKTRQEALTAAKAVANSLLVKTAIFGRDANWGRVISAVGASGVALDPGAIDIRFAGLLVAKRGAAIVYDAAVMTRALEQKEIAIRISLGAGRESARVLTCDLTHGYIKINADYHT